MLTRLCLSKIVRRTIIAAREIGPPRQSASTQPVRDHALEHGPFLRANGRRARGTRVDRALSHLLAAGLCLDLPARVPGRRRAGFDPGFLSHAD